MESSLQEVEALKKSIRQAFASVPYPGDGNLVAHANYGDEHTWTKEAFRGLDDWRTIEAAFLENPLDGRGNALFFFTPAAFRFYLPAYLLADLEKQLEQVDPAFPLSFGLTDADNVKPTSRKFRLEARRRGGQTRFDVRSQRFADFTPAQVNAVAAYLRYKLKEISADDTSRQRITQALQLYWSKHVS